MINNYEDALAFYQCMESAQSHCDEVLMTAIVELQQALLEFQDAQDRLREAELRVGRARLVIR